MCCDRVVQISVKNDMASSVGPAAHIDCHANGGGMARRIFDMNAHNGIFSAHPLGPKANGIDSILQKLFHISRSLIFIVGTNGTHQRLLGQQSRCLHRGGHAHTYEKRRTGIQAISCHHIHINMAKAMKIPVLGIVENYSYLVCPDCGKKISVFGESHIDEIAASLETEVLGKMPIDPSLASLADGGKFSEQKDTHLDAAVEKLYKLYRENPKDDEE